MWLSSPIIPRILPVALAVVLLSLQFLEASAQTPRAQPQAGWVADMRLGCKLWSSAPEADETVSWTGPCFNGLAEGNGTAQWFVRGRPGDRYEGDYKSGKMEGRGAYALADGHRYDGTFRADLPHGRGVFRYASGDRYEGEYRDGAREGRGVMVWADGRRYEGAWRADRPGGLGTLTDARGQVFTGPWIGGCFRDGDRRAAAVATAEDCGFK